MAKYLFLDIDGVLNSYPHDPDSYGVLDDSKIAMFKKLIDETGARIVLSSDWKRDFNKNLQPIEESYTGYLHDGKLHQLQSLAVTLLLKFEEFDLKLYDKTPTAPRSSRYDWYWERLDEIKWYIEEHLSDEDKYVILDDKDDGLSDRFGDRFVHTKYTEGLREKDCIKVKELLGD